MDIGLVFIKFRGDHVVEYSHLHSFNNLQHVWLHITNLLADGANGGGIAGVGRRTMPGQG